MQTTKLRWCIVSTQGPHDVLSLTLYGFRLYPSAAKAIAARLAMAERAAGFVLS